MADEDMEDYGFEYSDDEPEEQDVDIENQYYNSKGLVERDTEAALAGFAEVVQMEGEKGEWYALAIKSAIPHPRIMGIIHECGGKMHMAERSWTDAATDFFEAFKNYDEAGAQRRIQCLKYLVLANMLMESQVDPFDAQEAKPYKNDKEILAMTNLVAAYQRNEILEFEKILKSNRRTIMDDPFIRMYIEDLLKNIRTQVLLRLIKPYTRIRIPFVSKELNIPEKDVEQLLVSLILDNRVHGHIDQVNQLLELGDRSRGQRTYTALDKWSAQLRSLHQTVVNKIG
ncbi:unnamed protein product [Closterium sp. NIES-54]